ncbi:hypothetical protein Cni_G22061 [Canna indica]|uniref:PHD-type domain-containing protein n=1 Tax=Canna indica TaxID=4628 RepID=A0AAQ3KX92_9LILI|nr:hypothetical protein Cni_G22061 [Canna indica]
MADAGGPPDSDEYVIRSGVRSGLKREFTFALRSQALLPASLGRTRSGKPSTAFAAIRETKRPRKSDEDLPEDVAATVVGMDAAPIVVDCDAAPGQVVPSSNGDSVETLVLVDNCSESVAQQTLILIGTEAASPETRPNKPSVTVVHDDEPTAKVVPSANRAAVETVVSVDTCDEPLAEAAPSKMNPLKSPIVLDSDNELKADVPSRNGAAMETLVSVDGPGQSAAESASKQAKPIKVFVRSALRGKVGGLIKSRNRWVEILGSAPESAIVLDDGASCESDGGSLNNGRALENLGIIDCDDKLNDLASKTQSKSYTELAMGDTAEELLLKTSPLTMDIAEPLQGTLTTVNCQDGHLMKDNLPEKSMRRFTRSLLKVPPVDKEGPALLISTVRNGQDICKHDNGFPVQFSRRRFTRSSIKVKEEDSGSGVGAATNSESIGTETAKDGANSLNGSLSSTPNNKMELKMSKKISLTKPPGNVRELLSTGLLEGLPVKYYTSNGKRIELQGVIKGNGILCSCVTCDSSTVVSAYVFEQHAGSTKKHPADFIFLENGYSLHDVVNVCRGAPIDTLESAIQGAIGPVPPKKCYTCQSCKVLFSASRTGKFALLCDTCLESKQPLRSQIPLIGNAVSTRLVRANSTPDTSNNSSKNLSSNKKSSAGRLTRKDLGLHKLVFMSGILPEGTEVGYYVRGKRLLEGYIKDFGIYCRCCSTVVSPSQFEAHAGRAARRKPYNNIYTSNGVSLHELSVSLSRDRKLSATENDDLCSICADGGDLLLCDLCPRAFHKDCVGLPSIPQGDWHCQYCQNLHQRERSVACNDNAIAAGRVAGVDPIEQIFQRSIRIVTTSETDGGGCAICRSHDFSKSKFDDRTVMICDQCEKEYHVGCLREQNMADLKKLPDGEWFCCTDCNRIWNALQEFLRHGAQPLPGWNANVIKRKLEDKAINTAIDVDIRWRLLSGKTDSADSKFLLSRAVAIFHESFDPIVEATTGRDLIPSMVYGRTVRDQDFGGMFCAVLTVGSSVVSAGILRVLGSEVAELPLVATSRDHQGKGYFQSLFSCIEILLGSLNVKHFLLPAAEEAKAIWTNRFGFTKVNSDELQNLLKGARTTVFQGTSMLHKPVPTAEAFLQEKPAAE